MAKHSEIKKLRGAILEILRDFPMARDSDQWLTLKLWAVYHPSKIILDTDKDSPRFNKKYVYLDDIMHLPREDNVKRLRAKIQNEELLYLPTSWEVAKKRGIKEEQWKSYCLTN